MDNQLLSDIIIIGDVMLDEYLWGDANRISPEAPVPVVNLSSTEYRLGGAANVALNIRQSGSSVSIFSCVGNDSASARLQNLLDVHNIKSDFHYTSSQTTIKTRVMAAGQQLLRIDNEKECSQGDAEALIEKVIPQVKSTRVIVISDYAKGTVRDISNVVKLATKYSIPVIVDPKSKDLNIYRSCYLITPNLKEFKSFNSYKKNLSIFENAVALSREFDITWVVVTMGAQGMIAVNKDGENYILATESKDVVDVTGAGDTVISHLAIGVLKGLTMEQALTQANKAAGISVSRLGTTSVSMDDVSTLEKKKVYSVVERAKFKTILTEIRSQNNKIVMTNGCFDILHPGHLDYLKQSSQCGSVLIVALNSDASVRSLKGNSRPINSFTYRSKMLSGIDFIDFIIEFDEDTPENIIKDCLPDVLTKGSDYDISGVVGRASVEKNGGEVVLIELLDGYSTSNTITRIVEKQFQPS